MPEYNNSSGETDGAAFDLCGGQEDEDEFKLSQEEEK